MSGNNWTNFVREKAGEMCVSYMVAIKDPSVSAEYKDLKKNVKQTRMVDNYAQLKDDALEMAELINPTLPKRKAGRPAKYANDEERKEAKKAKTLASNKKKREEKRELII